MQKIYRVLLFIGLISFIGCRKENNVFDGPSINETYSTFKVIDPFKVSKNTVDFNAGESVYFSASFNKVVTWQIDIVGSTSKAHKIIEGSGKTINISNATWNGSTTIFPIFAAENCDAKLTIKDIADTFLVNVQITQAKKIEGLMIADFETGLNSSWTKFIQSGADMDFKVKTDSVAPQGLKYLNMAGTVNINGAFNWNVGSQISATTTLITPLSQFYSITAANAVTITLPIPSLSIEGTYIVFKRISGSGTITFLSVGNVFIGINTITLTTNLVLTFGVNLICNGTSWCQI